METVTLYRGTNKKDLNNLMSNVFADLSWWTTNLNNLSHYNEGACIELIIKADSKHEKEYIANRTELTPDYTFGRAEMSCPKDSVWYSISKKYMEKHIVSIAEIPGVFSDDEDDC